MRTLKASEGPYKDFKGLYKDHEKDQLFQNLLQLLDKPFKGHWNAFELPFNNPSNGLSKAFEHAYKMSSRGLWAILWNETLWRLYKAL